MDITIACKHQAIGNTVDYTNANTGQIRQYRSGFKVKNKYKSSLLVKSEGDGSFINIRGNFVKFLQGHNIFGSNNLKMLAYVVVDRVLKHLAIPITESELDAINKGYFELHMVDIAWNYRQDASLIPRVIDEMGTIWRLRGHDVSNYSDETVYLNQHSKERAFKLYNKKLELAHNPLSLNLPYREKLLRYSVGLLRAELRLHKKALLKLGLTRGVNWSVDKVNQLRQMAVEEAQFCGCINRRLPSEKADQLKSNLRLAYTFWEDNYDLTKYFDSQVLRRLRKKFMEMGVNIMKPPGHVRTSKVNIAECISEENRLNYPKWALKFGVIHLHKK